MYIGCNTVLKITLFFHRFRQTWFFHTRSLPFVGTYIPQSKLNSTSWYGPRTEGWFWEALRAISPNYSYENCRQKAPHALREQWKDEVVHSKPQLIISMKMSTDKFLKAIGCLLSEFKLSSSSGKLIMNMCYVLFHRYKQTISIFLFSRC